MHVAFQHIAQALMSLAQISGSQSVVTGISFLEWNSHHLGTCEKCLGPPSDLENPEHRGRGPASCILSSQPSDLLPHKGQGANVNHSCILITEKFLIKWIRQPPIFSNNAAGTGKSGAKREISSVFEFMKLIETWTDFPVPSICWNSIQI